MFFNLLRGNHTYKSNIPNVYHSREIIISHKLCDSRYTYVFVKSHIKYQYDVHIQRKKNPLKNNFKHIDKCLFWYYFLYIYFIIQFYVWFAIFLHVCCCMLCMNLFFMCGNFSLVFLRSIHKSQYSKLFYLKLIGCFLSIFFDRFDLQFPLILSLFIHLKCKWLSLSFANCVYFFLLFF